MLESLNQGYQKVKLQKLSFSQKESDTLSQNIIFSAWIVWGEGAKPQKKCHSCCK
jgi:hypothetical protein